MKFWIKNPGTGLDDTMLTLAVYSLGVILLKFLGSEMSFGPVTFGNLDGAVVAAILTPTLGAYCARRYTDTVTPKDKNDKAN
jgi:hypothetical protein